MKIGIMGLGFVGGALQKYYSARGGSASGGKSDKKISVLVYDKFKRIGSVELINQADVVFICVPTPFVPKKGFDLSAVEEAIEILSAPKIVVIKSSVIPGTTEALQKKYPQHKILFNPEFLREKFAYYDLTHPSRQLLGVATKNKLSASKIMRLLPKAPYEKIMPSQEAEMVKYMANSFLSLKVIFANQFFDLCESLGINYETVKNAVVKDPRIGDSHFNVLAGDYRGFGGSCFPKDVNAIIELAEKRKVKPSLLTTMREINRKLLARSGLSESHFLTNAHKKSAKK